MVFNYFIYRGRTIFKYVFISFLFMNINVIFEFENFFLLSENSLGVLVLIDY